jgi:DNA-binding NarL/FixJ family response regulator
MNASEAASTVSAFVLRREAAVLEKLGAASRTEAATQVIRAGLFMV